MFICKLQNWLFHCLFYTICIICLTDNVIFVVSFTVKNVRDRDLTSIFTKLKHALQVSKMIDFVFYF